MIHGRPRRRLTTILLLFTLLTITLLLWSHSPQRTILQDHLPLTSSSLSPSTLCNTHHLPLHTLSSPHPRKIYDLFLLSTELDWLEIRLQTLSPHIDYFVILESPQTFTGRPKPLHLLENWSRFSKFHPQIIHRVIEDPGSDVIGYRTWDHEDYMRNSLFDAVFPELVSASDGLKRPVEGDVLVVSDVDEIPKPGALRILRDCDFPARFTLRSRFYYYSFQWLHRGEEWAHPQATIYRGLQNTIAPKDLRNGETGRLGWTWWFRTWWEKGEMWNAAWHCSSCFGSVGEMRTKMGSFSHSSWDTEENRDERVMLERVRMGKDLFGRDGEVYDRVERNEDVPPYIKENRERFGYMLDRDGKNAGFVDV